MAVSRFYMSAYIKDDDNTQPSCKNRAEIDVTPPLCKQPIEADLLELACKFLGSGFQSNWVKPGCV